jgi:glutamate 5-kinase
MRIVVKSGSAILSKSGGGLDADAVRRLTSQLVKLHQAGHEVILVSSGAIAAGVSRLGMAERPVDLRVKQAAAAVGQLALMRSYEDAFQKSGIIPAQILLTREDLANRERYLNIRNTFLHLLSIRSLPIVNENDTVSTEEIQFGDNDTLSAIVATKVDADRLILLSDVPGFYKADADGQLTQEIIPIIEKITADIEKNTSKTSGSKMSVGGMASKIRAAKMATSAGIETWIGSGYDAEVLEKIMANAPNAGTRFIAKQNKVGGRHAWIAFGRSAKGFLVLDDGALKAVLEQRKSLLPAGIKKIRGSFSLGDTVGLKSAKGEEIARGLVNFSSTELTQIRGRQTNEIAGLLGRVTSAEVIHRDNLVIL